MAYRLLNNAKMTVSAVASAGTGAFTLDALVAGFHAFASATPTGLADGDTSTFMATEGTAWELFVGTYTASGTSLARTTRLASSTGAAVTFTTAAVVAAVASVADHLNRWVQIGSTTTISGATANVVYTNLDQYSEIYLYFDSISHDNGSATDLTLFTSTNNGSSYSSDDFVVGTSAAFTNSGAAEATCHLTELDLGSVRMVAFSNVSSTALTNLSLPRNEVHVDQVGSQINAVKIMMLAGNMDAGTIKLYGRLR